jgi:hypothetical protein
MLRPSHLPWFDYPNNTWGNKNHEATHYEIFSIILLLSLSQVQMSSSASCSRTSSVCVVQLVWETNFHALTKQVHKIIVLCILSLIYLDSRREDKIMIRILPIIPQI